MRFNKIDLDGCWVGDRWEPRPRTGVVTKTWLLTWWILILFWFLGTYEFFNQTALTTMIRALRPVALLFADLSFVAMGLMTIRKKADWLNLAIFLALTIISALFNHMPLSLTLNGLRIYLGALFLIPVFRYIFARRERAAYFLNKFDRSLYWFLWLQWPCMLYELVVLGGGDRGGGSLGNFMSGIISTLIFAISFYLMWRRRKPGTGYLANLLKNWDLIFLLGPTMLNETKISFLYLLLYFILLVPMTKTFILRMIYIIPIVLLLAGGSAVLYMKSAPGADDIFSLDYLEYYVMGDDDLLNMVEIFYERGYGNDDTEDLQRGVKFAMLPAAIDDEPYGPWIGYGVSQFKGGTLVDHTDFFLKYEWLLDGTQMQLMVVLVDLGICGVIWLIYYTLVLFGFVGNPKRNARLRKELKPEDIPVTNKNVFFLLLLFWLISLGYQSMFPSHFMMLVITFLILASWHWNRIEQYDELIASLQPLNPFNPSTPLNENPDSQ